MKKLGKELEFISWIKRDGSGTEQVPEKLIKIMQKEEFDVFCLSISEDTYIASGFNSFVVKLKPINEIAKQFSNILTGFTLSDGHEVREGDLLKGKYPFEGYDDDYPYHLIMYLTDKGKFVGRQLHDFGLKNDYDFYMIKECSFVGNINKDSELLEKYNLKKY
jgi:hypothetical protein